MLYSNSPVTPAATESPAAGTATPPDLVPARMINEYSYCPRLCYLEWVQGEFAPSADTLDGAYKHRRVNRGNGAMPEAGASADDASTELARIHAASVQLSAPALGLTAIIDLVESADADAPPQETALNFVPAAPPAIPPAGLTDCSPDRPTAGTANCTLPPAVVPVEYKRGSVPDNGQRSWEPERVQLCVAGLILRENGYRCDKGVIYYIAAKTRVEIPFDDALVNRTMELVSQMKAMATGGQIPPPLVDSPKCPRCSLVGICLPDETRLLQATVAGQPVAAEPRMRTIIPTASDHLPLYVQEPRAYVGKKGDVLEVRSPPPEKKVLAERPLRDISQVVLMGDVQISTQTVQALCQQGTPLVYLSWGGWFYGMTQGMPSKNVELRMAQFKRAAEPTFALGLARAIVRGKIENQRTFLRRNGEQVPELTLNSMASAGQQAQHATDLEQLLGIEGNAAHIYFSSFSTLLKPRSAPDRRQDFVLDFNNRNRRPPVDPVNALLSYAYALLTKELAVACWAVGLDPYMGFYHQPKFGKPALALDLMEEFRPLIADSVAVNAINTGVVGPADFVRRGGAVALEPAGKKRFLQAYERRMESEVTHPQFGYRLTYRRVLEVQVRLVSRLLLGEIAEYPPFTTR